MFTSELLLLASRASQISARAKSTEAHLFRCLLATRLDFEMTIWKMGPAPGSFELPKGILMSIHSHVY